MSLASQNRMRRLADQVERLGGRSADTETGAPLPLTGTILDALALFGPLFTSATWATWRVFLKALFALPLEPEELAVYRRHTERETAPAALVREAWVIVGRRGGKSRMAALVAVFLACFRDYRPILGPGETGVVMVLAADRRQAQVVFRYVCGLLDAVPELSTLVARRLKESVVLVNGIVIEVHTSDYRRVRGRTVVAAIPDEIAFWLGDDGSANPDREVLTALRPAMATVPGALLLPISTAYARRGALWDAYQRYWAKDGASVLVWRGDTASMNPAVDPDVIAQAYADDPVAAAAEYGAEFRSDVEGFLTLDAVQAVTVPGRRELGPEAGRDYVAFADPSGGSQDSMTLAIAHRDGDRAVLDALREVRPPFSPDDVVREYCELLTSYGLTVVAGDHYSGEWCRERFRTYGITYTHAAEPKSALYRTLLPAVNSRRVELLEHARLTAQLVGLERRVARSGNDSIDHGPGEHDDVANAAAGALTLALPGGQPGLGLLEWYRQQAEKVAAD